MKGKFFKFLITMTVLVITLTGCAKQEQNIKGKLDAELGYVEDLIFKIANKYAKEEYIEDEEFKWEYIKGDVEKIHFAWSSMLLDLTEVNIENDKLLEYSNDLDNLLLSLKEENQINMLVQLNNLYEKIVDFENHYSDDKNGIERDKIKSGCLQVYSLANQEQYDNAKTQITIIIENYKNLMKDETYARQNGYDLNKVYILLEEYKNSIDIKNLDLIRMKYILVVEEL